MQFALICRDGSDSALARKNSRAEHLDQIHKMKAQGQIIDGGAILDNTGQMIGSIVLCEFPDRVSLDAYLRDEAYMRFGVWQDIEILPFQRVRWSEK